MILCFQNSCRVCVTCKYYKFYRTDNPLSLCQINTRNEEISIFLSLSGRPNIYCVAPEHRIEWLNYLYGCVIMNINEYQFIRYFFNQLKFSIIKITIFSLNDVQEYNTLFIHCLLFRCMESLIHLPVLLEMIYVQMPVIKHVILIKIPGTELCKDTYPAVGYLHIIYVAYRYK